jgi:hypothetical protein
MVKIRIEIIRAFIATTIVTDKTERRDRWDKQWLEMSLREMASILWGADSSISRVLGYEPQIPRNAEFTNSTTARGMGVTVGRSFQVWVVFRRPTFHQW